MVDKQPGSGRNINTNQISHTRKMTKPANYNAVKPMTSRQLRGTVSLPDTRKKQTEPRGFLGFFKKFIKPKAVVEINRYKEGVDRIFLMLVIIMLCLGTIMVFSASYAYALQNFGDSYYYVEKQILMAVLGLVAMILAACLVDYLLLEKLAGIFFIVTLALNFATPIWGIVSKGAKRWFTIFGIQFQPSELLKFAVVLLFAYYISKTGDKFKKYKLGLFPPLIVMAAIGVAMLLQSHNSGLIIIILICVAMMYIGDAPKMIFVVGFAAAVLLVFLTVNYNETVVKILVDVTGKEYAGDRLIYWLDPFKDPADKGYQIIQSLYAIGSGGLTGLGWGQSRQKYLFLPEPQNDFIFAIICEEMGFIGAILIIALFVVLIWRGFVIAYHAPNKFSSFVVMGITIKVAIQFLLNIAVVTNTIPNTGISLPFFSYGGTALIMLMGEMGVILSISRYSLHEKP